MATITMIVEWLLKNPKTVIRAVLGLSVACLIAWGVILHNQNKKLSERLETALNNVEAYQGIVEGAEDQNRVLKLTIADM